MEIRAYMKEDNESIHELLQKELGYEVPLDQLSHTIQVMLEEKNYQIFTACYEERVVGFIGIGIGYALEIEGKLMRILALAVSNDMQGYGIGTQLIKKCEDYAKQHDISLLTLNSGLARTEAHRFYEQQGFYKKGYSFVKKQERV